MCPELFPQGFYWYSKRKYGPGRLSKMLLKNLTQINANLEQSLILLMMIAMHPSEITSTETEAASTKTTAVDGGD